MTDTRDTDRTARIRGREDRSDGTLVVAQGTFDLLHPGHVHYLEQARAMGDELVVIVARPTNVDHKEAPICAARQRRELVAALEVVDEAILGDREDIFRPIEELDPDVIALGHDQHHDPGAIEAELESRGIDCTVERASGRESKYDDELLSTRLIVERILRRRG
ncbi:adenylyltransferase/cytidyltransferase family protein [Natronosalvus caseinilyticus]|uniref:adenylyltransferase/cytidyltransferase family protein n=1 Tax=Natronosalvus caseinilyticus TaxID=2953747 RepID=UPI0028AD1955|nr:adenylyltransferase/cytidyltransferase family protein [Natronosalvus caseinilyticus]